MAELHSTVAPLGFLLGHWSGEGEGDYPTTEPFGYREESIFWHVGKPFIGYLQRTWSVDDGHPSHSETGYWRCPAPGRVELVLAHPNGIVEISEGSVAGEAVNLSSTAMARSSSAKDVSAIARRLAVEGHTLAYTLEMAAVWVPLGFHLRARLRRVEGPSVPGGVAV